MQAAPAGRQAAAQPADGAHAPVSSWLSVCSRSSLPPPTPVPRERPTASISSMKMMHGAFSLACGQQRQGWRGRRGSRTAEESDTQID